MPCPADCISSRALLCIVACHISSPSAARTGILFGISRCIPQRALAHAHIRQVCCAYRCLTLFPPETTCRALAAWAFKVHRSLPIASTVCVSLRSGCCRKLLT